MSSFLFEDLQTVQQCLAGCSSVQQWLGVETSDDSEQSILIFPSSDISSRFICIELGDESIADRRQTGSGLLAFQRTSSTRITFYATAEKLNSDSAKSFLSDVSDMWSDFLSRISTPPGKIIDSWEVIPASQENPFRWRDDKGLHGYQLSFHESGRVIG